MSHNWAADIELMHTKFGFRDLNFDGDFLRFRQRFLEEELKELDEGILENDPEKVVDALIDLCVVAIGTLDLGGVNSFVAWESVFQSNMRKQKAENPSRSGSRGFDLIKPANWIPPDHKGNLGFFPSAIRDILQRMDETGIDRVDKLPVPSHLKTLEEFKSHALAKTLDYDDDHNPEFLHAAYYPDGINNIMYEISKKVKRIRRILRRIFEGGGKPITDSLDDSFRDISIYAAIGHTYINKKLEGQSEDRDIFNREMIP